MRTFLVIICSVLCGTALAETALIEPSHDNTLYESSQGALSNGAGTFIFAGLTAQPGKRRAVVAFKDLSDIPAGATITSVKFHLYLSKKNSSATTLRVMRLLSDWGEGTSDAMRSEGAGIAATMGDATWNHTFFDNQLWTNPGGDFDEAVRAQIGVDATGAYMIDSTSAMVADVQDWLDNPAGNFGWILMADESSTSARRFNSREHSDPDRRPMLEIEYSVEASEPTAVGDFSGPWFDPASDGEGYLIFKTSAGWLIYYFGYSADGDRLWLVSNLVVIESVVLGQTYEFSMLVGTPGSFEVPTASADLEAWGDLKVSLTDCVSGVFMLDGVDGMKTSNVTKLIGVEGTSCSTSVEASEPTAVGDFSGPWFDPASDGEGYLIFKTSAGWLIYYFGYSADGDRLWLVSNLVVIESVVLGQTYEFSMLVGTPGSFEVPTASADLEAWGDLKVNLTDCVSGVFMLDGVDGMKTSNVTKLIGVEGTSCSTQ